MDSRPHDRLATWAPWTVPEPDPYAAQTAPPMAPVVATPTPTADPHIASIFRTLRAVVGGNEMTIARRLGTDVSVVMDLEAGVTDFLPPWAQTERIVQQYGALAGVDVSAVLDAMAYLIASGDRARRPPPPVVTATLIEPAAYPVPARPAEPVRAMTPPPRAAPRPLPREPTPPPASPPPTVTPRLPRPALGAAFARASMRTTLVRASIGLVTLVALYLCISWAPQPLYASARTLPAPLDRPLRGLADTLVWITAPTRDGLRWIELSDPRARKADRLDIPAKR